MERGGTLRLGLTSELDGLDPQLATSSAALELFRCCLLRTLLSYEGRPSSKGGAELRPDLAVDLPRVSGDGQTWTFRIRPGIRYAPPDEDRTVAADDVVRAVERAVRGGGAPASLYEPIEGFGAFRHGRSSALEGLRVRGDHTLVVRLRHPVGDLGHRMAHPSAAPIPPGGDPDRGSVAALGPYMVTSAAPGRLTLVRNPSWESDPLRAAYPDRIEVRTGIGTLEAALLVDAAELDLHLDGIPPIPQIRKYAEDPQLQGRIHVRSSGKVRYVGVNPATPPFDDVWVRRAASLGLDRAALIEAAGHRLLGEPSGRIVPPSLLSGPAEPPPAGDPVEAAELMRRSSYDVDGDGACDAPCVARMIAPAGPPFDRQAELIAEDLARLGIEVRVVRSDHEAGLRSALTLPPPLTAPYPDPGAYLSPLLPSAPGAQLGRCEPLRDKARAACWREIEGRLLRDVVIPLYFPTTVDVVSENVRAYAFDGYAGLASIDRLGVGRGG